MGDVYSRFRVAAVQAASVMFDREKTVDKTIRFIEEAADKGASIIGFPETYIPGHPNLWFGAKKQNPLPIQGPMFREYVKNSVRVPSPDTDRLCTAARKAHAYVVVGISEQDRLYSGTLYLAQLFISAAGEIMGVHRKLVSTNTEKFVFTYGDGSYLNVYDTPFGRLSAMNCGEHAHSLFKYALLSMGTQIHVAAWASFPEKIYKQAQRDSVQFRVRQYSHEGKIFIINSCSVIDRQNIDFCCTTPEEKNNLAVNSGGGSAIIGPNGEYLAGPQYEGEGVLTAEISLEDTLAAKQVHNVLGHYTRWDVLSMNFNREASGPFKKPIDSVGSELAQQVGELRQEIHRLRERLDSLEKPKQ